MTEHRRFTRIQFVSRAELVVEGRQIEAEVLDLSLMGALIRIGKDDCIPLNDSITFNIILTDDLVLSFQANAVHQKDDHWGLQFISKDLESFTHLRRLCEMNALDPDKITGELAFLANI